MLSASHHRSLVLVGTAILIATTLPLLGSTAATTSAESSIQAKLDRLIVPNVQFAGATLAEAVEFMRTKSRELDQTEPDPSARGINFHLNENLAKSDTSITLDLKGVPMIAVLHYVTEFSGVAYAIKANGVFVGARDELLSPIDCGVGEDWAPNKRHAALKKVLQIRASAKILPQVQFAGASLEEAVEFIRLAVNSVCEVDHPASINILLKPGGKQAAPVNLDLKNISAWDALRSVALLTDHELRADAYALVLTPKTNP